MDTIEMVANVYSTFLAQMGLNDRSYAIDNRSLECCISAVIRIVAIWKAYVGASISSQVSSRLRSTGNRMRARPRRP